MSSDEIEKLARDRLDAYCANPPDVRDHYLGEQSARSNYTGRVLLELLQNAEDALAEQEQGGKILLKLCGNLLFVANQGLPFTLRGIAALGAGQDSPKRGRHLIGCKGTGFKAVLNWTERPEIHSDDYHVVFDRGMARASILEAIGGERIERLRAEDITWSEEDVPLLRIPIVQQPEGPALSILLQDMNTVICLPIRPEVHSAVENELRECCVASDRYVFLRWLEEISVLTESIEHTIAIRRPPVPALDAGMLEIQLDGEVPIRMVVFRTSLDGLAPSDSKEAGLVEVAIALPQEGSAWPQDARVYNFFPTLKASPFAHIPLHATFLLKPDRNDFREDDFEYHQRLVGALVELFGGHDVQNCLKRFGPDTALLLKTTPCPDQHDKTHHMLWSKLQSAASNSRFVLTVDGRTYATPNETRLWKWGLGELLKGASTPLAEGYLADGEWQRGERFDVLRGLGAQELENLDYLEALKAFTPRTWREAYEALTLVANVLNDIKDWTNKKVAQERIKKLELWPTSSGTFRDLSVEPARAFFYGKQDGFEVPHWVGLDELLCDFETSLLNENGSEGFSLLKRLGRELGTHLRRFDKQEFIETALVPSLVNKTSTWWEENGTEVLRLLKRMELEKSQGDECPWFDGLRGQLARNVRVPARDGSWRPAWQTYAGEDWDNPAGEKMLDYLDESRRLALAIPARFPDGRDCAGLLRYLGVSWSPKLIFRDVPKESRTFVSDLQKLCKSPFGHGVSLWEDYVQLSVIPNVRRRDEELDKEKGRRAAQWALSSAWGFECLEPFLNTMNSNTDRFQWLADCRNKIVQAERSVHAIPTIIERQGSRGGEHGFITAEEPFALWQLGHTRSFSVSQTPLFAGGVAELTELFLRSPGQASWFRWLPHLDLSSMAEGARLKKLELVALEMGAKSGLEDLSPATWIEWLKRLPKLAEEDTRVTISDMRRFLHDLARSAERWTERPPLPDDGSLLLPCQAKDRDIEFVLASEVHILDDTRWAHLQTVFVDAKLHLLLAEFGAAEILATQFGLEDKLLSKALVVHREDDTSDEDQTNRIQDLLSKGWGSILALVASPDKEAEAKRLREELNPTQVKACRQLEVSLTMRDGNMKVQHCPAFYFEILATDSILWVDTSNESILWDNVAQGIKHVSQRKDPFEDALARLLEKLEKNPEEAPIFLRMKGIDDAAVSQWSEPERAISGGVATATVTVSGPNGKRDRPGTGQRKRKSQGGDGEREKPERAPRSGYGDDEAREAGYRAEEWVRQELQSALSGKWDVSERPGRDQYNRETDIIIGNDDLQIHVEVKSLKGSTVFWSSLEVEKAIELGEKYVMVIAKPSQDENEFDLFWIYSPTERLWESVKGGEWDWKTKRIERGSLSAPWILPGHRPNEAAEHFCFLIEVTSQTLDKFDKGIEKFVQWLSES